MVPVCRNCHERRVPQVDSLTKRLYPLCDCDVPKCPGGISCQPQGFLVTLHHFFCCCWSCWWWCHAEPLRFLNNTPPLDKKGRSVKCPLSCVGHCDERFPIQKGSFWTDKSWLWRHSVQKYHGFPPNACHFFWDSAKPGFWLEWACDQSTIRINKDHMDDAGLPSSMIIDLLVAWWLGRSISAPLILADPWSPLASPQRL